MLFDSQVSGPDTFVIHFRDDPSLDFAIFAKGYRLAASTLTQSLLSRPAWPDYEAYPVVFLYRHSLELYLKNVISKGARLARLRGQELQQKMLYIHDLTKLTSTAVGILRILFPRDSSLLEMLPKLECIVREFAHVDPDSITFRYPTDTKGHRAHFAPLRINLSDFALTMNSVLEVLDVIDFGVDVETDKTEELNRILESFLNTY